MGGQPPRRVFELAAASKVADSHRFRPCRYMTMRKDMPFFANARTVRNAIDLARMKSAIRIFNEKTQPGSNGTAASTQGRVHRVTASTR